MLDYTRITIPISIQEGEALRRLAKLEMRDARKQASIIIREELMRRGLLEIPTVKAGDSVQAH